MGSLENRLRKKWQDYSGSNAASAENSFFDVFNQLFESTDLVVIKKPTKFSRIYLDVPLDYEELSEIYVPPTPIKRHGITPDFLIRNNATGKEIYIEIKRQDGWVENKQRHDGRGNAHERLCKYFTPGLLRVMRSASGIGADNLPFWIVMQGDVTRDICHVKELRLWFDSNRANLFFWRDTADKSSVIKHFLDYILPMLE